MKLIIINGPSGIGKSTVAKMLHEDMPMSFLLDIDAQRRYISHYRENPEESETMSHVIGKNIVLACFESDRDVILKKLILRANILDAYRAIAEKYGAGIQECILWASKNFVMERTHARGWRENGLLTPEKCELFWEKMNRFKEERMQAKLIDVMNLSTDEVYKKIKEIQF
ncbi:TPA: hypothetical protein DEB00_02905 [Candidatus Uhrbacteria bacterium]|nr:hypothetical protein [Candidatus Uhrbacteria bacterium]